MISRDDAHALAGTRLGPDVELHEFPLGYVAWARLPEGPLPVVTEQPTVVIDKASGAVTPWAALPCAVVAAQYTAQRTAPSRFPADVRAALAAAGWSPGRDHGAAVATWLASPPVAREFADIDFGGPAWAALTEFGGLEIAQHGAGTPDGGYPSRFFPVAGPVAGDAVRAFTARTGITVTPVGDHEDGPADLALAPDGRVFLLHWSDAYVVADSVDAALVWMVRGGLLKRFDPDV